DKSPVQEQANWAKLSRDNGLLSDKVQVLKWLPARSELFIGTELGVSIFRLSLHNGELISQLTDTLTESRGLPEGAVLAVSPSSDGQNVWLLIRRAESIARLSTSYQVVRWDRAHSQRPLIGSEAFLLVMQRGKGPPADPAAALRGGASVQVR